MKKIVFVLIAALGLSTMTFAQANDKEYKKAVKAAQKLVKDSRNEMQRDDISDKSNAKRLIDQAIVNEYLQDWDQTWLQAADVYRYYFNDEYRKTYMDGQRYDTVGMYGYMTKWFDFAIKADSLEQIPDAKGRVSYEARQTQKDQIINNMSNLINAGIFYFNNRADYAKAYELFDRYFTMAELPMFKADMENDNTYKQYRKNFSYFPALAAFNLEQWENALKYAKIAQDDEEYGESAYEFLCESYVNLGDSANWLDALKQGMVKYPTVDYYYSKLLNYYSDKNNMAALEEFVNEMVKLDPEKAYNYYVLGYVAQQNKDYEKAISQYEKAIEKDASLEDAYNNMGLCILSIASDYDDQNSKVDPRSAKGKEVQAKLKEYYQRALPVYQKFREVAPGSISKWGIGLYNIYYNLKMDKEFKDIEKLLESNHII